MAEKIHLIPAEGATVVDLSDRRPLPPEGKTVEMSVYWQRRINDGSVTVRQEAAKPATKQKSK